MQPFDPEQEWEKNVLEQLTRAPTQLSYSPPILEPSANDRPHSIDERFHEGRKERALDENVLLKFLIEQKCCAKDCIRVQFTFDKVFGFQFDSFLTTLFRSQNCALDSTICITRSCMKQFKVK